MKLDCKLVRQGKKQIDENRNEDLFILVDKFINIFNNPLLLEDVS